MILGACVLIITNILYREVLEMNSNGQEWNKNHRFMAGGLSVPRSPPLPLCTQLVASPRLPTLPCRQHALSSEGWRGLSLRHKTLSLDSGPTFAESKGCSTNHLCPHWMVLSIEAK